jgi:hypothetical protein
MPPNNNRNRQPAQASGAGATHADMRGHINELHVARRASEGDARRTIDARIVAGAGDGSAFSQLGPKCFGPDVRRERYPDNFKGPRAIKNYDVSKDPKIWIDNYAIAMEIANASELVATRYLPLMLDGSMHMWINNLPHDSINSWEEMRTAFIENFEGTCKRPATIEDLRRCMQKDRESTRRWLKRWSEL